MRYNLAKLKILLNFPHHLQQQNHYPCTKPPWINGPCLAQFAVQPGIGHSLDVAPVLSEQYHYHAPLQDNADPKNDSARNWAQPKTPSFFSCNSSIIFFSLSFFSCLASMLVLLSPSSKCIYTAIYLFWRRLPCCCLVIHVNCFFMFFQGPIVYTAIEKRHWWASSDHAHQRNPGHKSNPLHGRKPQIPSLLPSLHSLWLCTVHCPSGMQSDTGMAQRHQAQRHQLDYFRTMVQIQEEVQNAMLPSQLAWLVRHGALQCLLTVDLNQNLQCFRLCSNMEKKKRASLMLQSANIQTIKLVFWNRT